MQAISTKDVDMLINSLKTRTVIKKFLEKAKENGDMFLLKLL